MATKLLCIVTKYRVSHNIGPTFFCYFVGFYYTEIQKYRIGTRILKIDLEVAEIIDVKDGTCYLEVDILLFL